MDPERQEQPENQLENNISQGMEIDESLNSMFDFDFEKQAEREEEEAQDFSEFDGVGDAFSQQEEEQEEEQEDAAEAQGLNLDGEEQEDAPDAGSEAAELEDLNKRFNTEYKTLKEFQDALSGVDAAAETSGEEQEYEQAANLVDFYTTVLDPAKTGNEDLMRRKFETDLMNKGTDLNSDEAKAEINDMIETLKDTYQLDLRADLLRKDLRAEVLNPALQKKNEIEASRTQREQAAIQSEKDQMKDALGEIFNNKEFFGIAPEQSVLQEVYKKFNSGELVRELTSDKKALAEIAVMRAYRKEISKKASSGLSYNDGRKSVLGEFDSKPKESIGPKIVSSQKRGTNGSADKSVGLMASLRK